MAEEGPKTYKSQAEIDKEAIQKYNERLKYQLERERKLERQWAWRGNKLPPFNIEPFAHERQRLAGKGMTPEERAMRVQWVKDQMLAADEPKHIPELQPRNIFRRIYAWPYDMIFKGLKPIIGEKMAVTGRYYIPKLIIGYVSICAFWYHLKYNPASWQGTQGWHMYAGADQILPGDPRWPNPPERSWEEFNDKGFKDRKAMLDLKTSRSWGQD